MANPEHLERLKSGVEKWNRWRQRDRDVRPDLREADLTGMDMSGAFLRGAIFSKARMVGVSIARSFLSSADFSFCDLRKADLSRVETVGTRFFHTDLTGATLADANLSHADFSTPFMQQTVLTNATVISTTFRDSRFSESNVTGARFASTVLANCDLSFARGLQTINHLGSSSVDLQTLINSRELPIVFLRGCGLPERIIEFLPSLTEPAFSLYSCFISYSTMNTTTAPPVACLTMVH
jgi:hypothetical protein